MNILCVSLNEIGLWMNIFWIYRSRYTSCVGTRPAFNIGRELERRHSTCFYDWEADRLSAEGGSGCFSGCIERMLDNVQYPQIYCFPITKLLHRAMLRSERRCGSRSRQTSNRAIARSEGSSAVPPRRTGPRQAPCKSLKGVFGYFLGL